MKKIFKILLIVLMLIPSFLYKVPEVKAKTIRDLRRELQEIEARESENSSDINKTESEIENDRIRIQQNNAEIQQINVDIAKLDEEIVQLGKDIEEKDKTTKNLMYSLQTTNGNSFYIEYLFGADSITDFIYRYSITEQITNYNEKLIEEMNEMIEENEKKKVELDEKQKSLNEMQTRLANELDTLERSSVKLYQLRGDIRDEIRNAKKIIQTYIDAGCGEDEDIRTCANKLLPPDTKFWRPFGPGYITSGYGWRYAIYSGGSLIAGAGIHEALDISNGYGSNQEIYSVANGKVKAIWYDQWGGNQIVIHHNINGKNWSSTYAHLSRVVVKEEDIVTKDTVIGYMGSTGSASGPHLHLGISTGLRFVDYTGTSGYVAHTVDPRTVINFPSSGGWSDRISYYN